MDTVQDPRVGTVLQERYRILSRIAAGGMGVVYRAERVQLERTVAVKFLHPWIVGEKDIVRRFEIEARAMSRLFHPHCTAVTDFGVDDGAPYLVMDFVTGATLKSILEKGPMRAPRAIGIVRQVLAGLAHAHGHGIIHRDVKPANIVLTDATGTGDHIKILDFGLAKLRDSTSDLTSGLAVGTPCYMSPEQTLSDRIDERSDVYAAGVLLVELLTGRRPFEAEEAFDILAMHREAPRPRLKELAPGLTVSDALEEVVAKALAKRREDRFASATEFSSALGATPEGRMVSSLKDAAVPAPAPVPEKPALPAKQTLPATVAMATPTTPRAPRKLWVLPLLLLPIAAAVWLLARDGESGAGEGRSASGEVVAAASSAASAETPEGNEAPSGEPAELEDRPISDDRPEIRRVQGLMRARRWDQSLRELGTLRKRFPDDALIPFLIGNVYFSKTWWSEGLAAYRETIAKDPSYRENQYLIRDVIGSLTSDRFHGKAESFLLREIGPVAIPYLEVAAARRDTVGMSQRAAYVLKRLRTQR